MAGHTTLMQLYNSPVGLPRRTGWSLRDTSLQLANTGVLSPTAVPFALTVPATYTPGAALASLVNEDGVSLQVKPAAGGGFTAAPAVVGQVSGDTVTYPALAAQTDVAVRATISGIDLHIVLHGPTINSLSFMLTAGQGARLVQETGDAVLVKRPIKQCGSTGCITTQQPEYVLEPPVLRDSRVDPAAAVLVGPVGVSLAASASAVTLTIDNTWLHDPRRVFPVRLDVPIITALAAFHTGLFGTLNSCAPSVPVPLTTMVVGVEDSCTYHGFAYFDVSALLPGSTIQSATFNLYTPAATGVTGVQVYPNRPPRSNAVPGVPLLWQPLSWQPPGWASAPQVVPGAAGIAEQAQTPPGQWHRWDITSLVQQWVNERRQTNGGLTLVSTGAPVAFASPLGDGSGSPATAPYLSIVYQPPSPAASGSTGTGAANATPGAVTPQYSDGAGVIYGVAGSSVPDGTCGGAPGCNGAIEPDTVSYRTLYGGYLRIGVYLECNVSSPGLNWWEYANTPNYEPVFQLMQDSWDDGVIPVVNFIQNGDCNDSPASWYDELSDFMQSMEFPGNPYRPQLPLPPTYFEIGNEWNDNAALNSDYYDVFGEAAEALYSALSAQGDNEYVILTGGVDAPAAESYCNPNLSTAEEAIAEAEYTYYIPSSHLGVAVHPYGYDSYSNISQGGNAFINYYETPNEYGYYNSYAGVCGDLGDLVTTWTSSFPGLPVFFTEDNWTSASGNTDDNQATENVEGAYLVDLFTWFYDNGYANPSSSPVRVAWFQGLDSGTPVDLGLYDFYGDLKSSFITYCPYLSELNDTYTFLSADYTTLVNADCY